MKLVGGHGRTQPGRDRGDESEREKQRQQFGLPKKGESGGRLLKRTDTDPEEREDNEKWTAMVSEVKQRTDGD